MLARMGCDPLPFPLLYFSFDPFRILNNETDHEADRYPLADCAFILNPTALPSDPRVFACFRYLADPQAAVALVRVDMRFLLPLLQ